MKLKEERQKRNLTQEEMANILNMKKQTYQNYELNKRQPDISTLIRIADFFNVSLDYLCDRPNSNYIGFLPNNKKDTILAISQLDDIDFGKVEAYVSAIKDSKR